MRSKAAARCLLLLVMSTAYPKDMKSSAPNTARIKGDVTSIANAVMMSWSSKNPPIILSKIALNETMTDIAVNAYDSREVSTSRAIYRDNCVASAAEGAIDCDLKLVDDLIDDFKLGEIFGSGKGKFRRSVFKWIFSHELGHIALKHGLSDYDEGTRGYVAFDATTQRNELDADAFSLTLIGSLLSPGEDYGVVLSITNALIRKAVCPETFPKVCKKMPAGVGLVYDYTEDAKPIKIQLYGTHPAYIARFLRILYLSGVGAADNGLTTEAKAVIDQLQVQDAHDNWVPLRKAFSAY